VLETRFHRLGKRVFSNGGRGVFIWSHWKLAVRQFPVTWRTVRQELTDLHKFLQALLSGFDLLVIFHTLSTSPLIVRYT
jgi:hypothetical protein